MPEKLQDTDTRVYRCDGCGDGPFAKYEVNHHKATKGRLVRYCDQCDALRDQYDIRVEDHEQYRLQELADQLAAEGGS